MRDRVIAGLVGLAVVLPLVVWGGRPAVAFLVGIVLLVGAWEFAAMALPGSWPPLARRLAPALLALYLAALLAPLEAVPAVALAVAAGLLVSVLFGPWRVEAGAGIAGRCFLGLAWLALLFPLPFLRGAPHGLAWIFLLLAVTWLGDTGAYFAGRALGRHRLMPAVSPKKTWEGVVGGAVAAVAGALVVRAIGLPHLPAAETVLLALALHAAGVVGDLVESMVKRSFGVKDSGWIMPGHGGILDRVDSLMFSGTLLALHVSVLHAT